MATTTRSPESYIGSLLNIISNSSIRYEGLLFHINPRHSTIALQNVRCFGTEGRRNDGPEVPPSDVVYDCIYFRGSDIKDLKVLSSPTLSESTHSIHDDPAIIECHSFHHPAAPSGSGFGTLSAVATSSSKSFTSGSLPELISGSAFHCSLHQYNQPISSAGSCIPSLPAANNRESSSSRISDLQQRASFLQPPPPPVFLLSPGHQQMQYSLSDFPESSHSMPKPVNCSFSDSVSSAMPSSTLSITFPMGGLLSLAAQAPSNQMENDKPSTAIVEPSSSWTPMAALASSCFELNAVAHQTVDKLQPVIGSALPYQSELMPTTSTVGTSHSDLIAASILSPVTPDQILLPGSVNISSYNPLQMRVCHKDIEVVQSSTSPKHASTTSPLKSPSAEDGTTLPVNVLSTEKEPNLPLKQRSVEKSNRAPSHLARRGKNEQGIRNRSNRGPSNPQHHGWLHNQGRIEGLHGSSFHIHHIDKSHVLLRQGHKLDGVSVHTHHGQGAQVWGRGNKLGGTASYTHHGKGIQGRGKGNKLYGAASDAPFSNKVHAWGMKNRMNDPALRSHTHSWSQMKGQVKVISRKVTKFTEDFDFVAMNEKFNKDEIWGQLGKTSNNQTNNKGKANVSHEDNVSNEDASGLPIVGTKSVYVKDEFFDSLSCNITDYKATRGRVKNSEQMKLDKETFGEFRIHRGYRGGQGHRFRGVYGHAGKDRGQTMRSCFT